MTALKAETKRFLLFITRVVIINAALFERSSAVNSSDRIIVKYGFVTRLFCIIH